MKPTYQIVVDGTVVNLHGRLIQLTVTDKRGMEADELTLDISDTDGLVELPPKQALIDLQFGFKGEAQFKGQYTVDSIEHSGPPDTITVRARSAAFKDTFTEPRDKSWHGHTLGVILDTIAQRNGLTLAISDALKNVSIPHIDQTDESDAHFITRLSKRYGAMATVKQQRLLFLEKDSNTTASGHALPLISFNRADTTSHHYSDADRQERVTGVKAFYQDTKKAKRKSVSVGETGYQRTLKHSYPTKAEALAAAQAEFKAIKTSAKECTLNLKRGVVSAAAEHPARLMGFKPQIDAQAWTIDEVTHTVNGQGYVTNVVLVAKF